MLCGKAPRTMRSTYNGPGKYYVYFCGYLLWLSLNNIYITNKYTITVGNKFDTLQEIQETLTPNNEYKNFVNAHTEAAAECLLTNLRTKHRVQWKTLTETN